MTKKQIKEKCLRVLNACSECKNALEEVELKAYCENCMSKSRYDFAKEILEELNA